MIDADLEGRIAKTSSAFGAPGKAVYVLSSAQAACSTCTIHHRCFQIILGISKMTGGMWLGIIRRPLKWKKKSIIKKQEGLGQAGESRAAYEWKGMQMFKLFQQWSAAGELGLLQNIQKRSRHDTQLPEWTPNLWVSRHVASSVRLAKWKLEGESHKRTGGYLE